MANFSDWKIGQTGWVRVANDRAALAVRTERDVTVCYGDGSCGNYKLHEPVNLIHDCTGFDCKPEAKHLPWTFETFPGTAIKVRSKLGKRRGDQLKAIAWLTSASTVNVDEAPMSLSDLLNDWEQLDGTPCGQLVE